MKFRREKSEVNGKTMKRLFRRNQIIITTLAIMIAAAGYLNYAGKKELETSNDEMIYEAGSMDISDEDLLTENQAANYKFSGDIEEAETLAQIDSWDEGETVNAEASEDQETSGAKLAENGTETGIENPGEAVLTNGLTVSDYIAGVQLNREQTRAKNKETLNSIINNTNIEDAAKQQAVQDMITMTEIAEKENAAETLLQAKGFSNPVVSVSSGKVDVVINASSITDQQRAQIEDIVKRKTEVPADGIVITLMKLEE